MVWLSNRFFVIKINYYLSLLVAWMSYQYMFLHCEVCVPPVDRLCHQFRMGKKWYSLIGLSENIRR
jgi:hypothetical protein